MSAYVFNAAAAAAAATAAADAADDDDDDDDDDKEEKEKEQAGLCMWKTGQHINHAAEDGTSTAVILAAKGCHLTCFQYLVVEHEADIHKTDKDGYTALFNEIR